MNNWRITRVVLALILIFFIISCMGCGGGGVSIPELPSPTWKTVDAGLKMKGVAYGYGEFVTLTEGDSFRISSDGIIWTYVPNPLTTICGWNAIAMCGPYFIVVGSINKIMTSTNGTDWTVRDCGNHQGLSGVTSNGSIYVAVGANGKILTSPDTVTWTSRNSHTSAQLKGVAWDGTQFITVGFSGTILTSSDGITWTARNSGTTNDLYSVTWTGSNIVAVGDYGILLSSSNGLTWSYNLTGIYETLNYVTWNGSRLIVISSSTINHRGVIYSSPGNIYDLSIAVNEPFKTFSGVCWGGSTFVAVGDHEVQISANGDDWEDVSLYGFNKVIWTGSQFVAVGDEHSSRGIYTSPDGITWTAQKLITSLNCLQAITQNGSKLVAVGDKMLISQDGGLTWNEQDLGLAVINLPLMGVVWGASKYVIVSCYGGIYTSPDAVTWTARNSGTNANLIDIVWNGSLFVAIGTNGTIITSPDGITWTRQNPAKSFLNAVVWNGSMFVIMGSNIALQSPDGINWSSVQLNRDFFGVTWNGSEFMAVGRSIYKSTDGSNWGSCQKNDLPDGLGLYLNGVAWNGSHYVAVGEYGTILISQ